MEINRKIADGNRLVKNVSWIFFGNVVHAILVFLLNIFVARSLTLNDNGLLTYSTSWINFFTAVGTLGFNGIISREFSKNENKSNEYIWSCIFCRILFGIIAIILVQILVKISSPHEPLLHLIVLCQSSMILFSSFDLFIYWYRYKNQAKVTAVYRLIAFFISAFFRVVAIGVIKSVVLYVIGVSLETLLFVSFLYKFYRKHYTKRIIIKKDIAFKMLGMSYPFIFSAILSMIYGQADKIMLKSMIDNTSVALYNAATTIAGLVVIIPTTLIEGFRPDIMDAKIHNEKLYQKRLSQLYSIVFWCCVAYGIVISLFSKPIIYVLYGEKYFGAAKALSLIVWYTSFSYFGAINNVFMVAEEKQKWVQITTLVGAIANVILNFIFIPMWGIVGAALASFLTQILANFVMMFIFRDLQKGFKIMLRGILFKGIF